LPTFENTDNKENNVKIKRKKLILAEGKDAYHFLCHACEFYREVKDVQVIDFGGIGQLTNFLKLLANNESYDDVETIVIARDAEMNAKAAADSIKHSMSEVEMSIPQKPFEYFENSSVKTAFMIFPGPQQKVGTLEDLCFSTVENDPLLNCVDDYLECAKGKGEQFPRIHKNRLYCFLAGKDDFIGSRIGLAFRAKVFPSDHPVLEPFKRIIQEM